MPLNFLLVEICTSLLCLFSPLKIWQFYTATVNFNIASLQSSLGTITKNKTANIIVLKIITSSPLEQGQPMRYKQVPHFIGALIYFLDLLIKEIFFCLLSIFFFFCISLMWSKVKVGRRSITPLAKNYLYVQSLILWHSMWFVLSAEW